MLEGEAGDAPDDVEAAPEVDGVDERAADGDADVDVALVDELGCWVIALLATI